MHYYSNIRLATPKDQPNWDNFVWNHKQGLAYHFYAWKEAIEQAYGFECPYLLAESEGTIKGILPLAHIHTPISKGKLVSLPYCDIGGILADSQETANELFSSALEYTNSQKINCLEIRDLAPLPGYDSEKTRHPGKVRMVSELSGHSVDIFNKMKAKLRNQIKKPQREGLKVKSGGIELLDEFYPIFASNMTYLGSPVHSRKWLQKIVSLFDSRSGINIVMLPDGTPAAGGIHLASRETFTIPWASSLRKYNHWNPNMLLYWSFLQKAADKGYKFFDFGRSSPNEGTFKFKKQWGAEPMPLYWVNMQKKSVKEGFIPSLPGSENGTSGYARIWAEKTISKIPVSINRSLGPRLRKYISL